MITYYLYSCPCSNSRQRRQATTTLVHNIILLIFSLLMISPVQVSCLQQTIPTAIINMTITNEPAEPNKGAVISLHFPLKKCYITELQTPGYVPTLLVSFTGKLQNGHSFLTWVEDGERNNGYYIEKSTDGTLFSVIGYISKQTKEAQKVYHYIDGSATDPVQYYRLQSINKDGRKQYSPILKLENSKPKVDLQVYPTITTGSVNLSVSEGQEDEVMIVVYNNLGSRVWHKKTTLTAQSFSVDALAKGSYRVSIVDKYGENLATSTIIKR